MRWPFKSHKFFLDDYAMYFTETLQNWLSCKSEINAQLTYVVLNNIYCFSFSTYIFYTSIGWEH